MLPERLLVFGHYQNYFTCHHGFTFCEDTAFEHTIERATDRPFGQIYGIQDQSNFRIYSWAVFKYTERNFTYPEDVITAFHGVLSRLRASFRGEFIFGLPSTELDQALLWHAECEYLKGYQLRARKRRR